MISTERQANQQTVYKSKSIYAYNTQRQSQQGKYVINPINPEKKKREKKKLGREIQPL